MVNIGKSQNCHILSEGGTTSDMVTMTVAGDYDSGILAKYGNRQQQGECKPSSVNEA